MIRNHKKQLIAASALILLPILVGLLLMDRLPEAFATHWGMDGQSDGWSSRSFAIFVPPVIMLALFWVCVFFTGKDPGNQDGRNKKPFAMVLWIVPFLSNLCCGMMYALALGAKFSVTNLMLVVMGLLFLVIGNYMPKCQMNSTIGIKVPWAYTSEENWNATHRFAGRVWVMGGILLALSALIPSQVAICVMLGAIFVLAFLPMIYSWRYYKKQLARGDELKPLHSADRKMTKGSLVAVSVILVIILVIMFTGSIDVTFGDTAFTVDATFHEALTVEYSAIDTLELREGNVPGTREWGFGSARLLLGFFENEEFGTYTRYTYTSPDSCIVITVGEKVLVISGRDPAETRAIYDTLVQRTGK